MENKLAFLIYELKGIVYSVDTLMNNDQEVNHDLVEQMIKIVDQAVEIIEN